MNLNTSTCIITTVTRKEVVAVMMIIVTFSKGVKGYDEVIYKDANDILMILSKTNTIYRFRWWFLEQSY